MMIVLFGKQSEMVGGVEAVGVPDIERCSQDDEPIDDCLHSLHQRVLVGAVALDQEVGLRKGFQLHLQLQLITILPPNTNLQLKYMNQQNIVVETIINRIISRSRKNSLESFDCKTVSEKSQYSHQSEPFDQEYIIKKSDLRSFIQKMALENYENNIAIERKTKENLQIKNEAQKWKGQYEQLKKTLEKCQQAYKKKIEDLQGKCLKQRKERQKMELELNWSTNKIKEHMREIDKLKQSTITKNQPKREIQNGSANHVYIKEKNEYVTPGKEGSKKLQSLNVKNCQSIDYSLLNSDVVHKFIIEHYPQAIRECSTEQSKQRNCVLNSLENHSSKKGGQNIEISRFHRHAEIDEKERMLKMLGEKCLFLESYIQKLTKKYLGEVVYTQQSDRDRYDDRMGMKQQPATNLKVIEQQSASSLQRSESEIGLSSAFRVQPQI